MSIPLEQHLLGLRAARERCRTYPKNNGQFWLSYGVPFVRLGPRGGRYTTCHRPNNPAEAAAQLERDPAAWEHG